MKDFSLEASEDAKDAYIKEHKFGIPFRWDPLECNEQITLCDSFTSATPDNGNWNAVLGDKDLIPGNEHSCFLGSTSCLPSML